MPSAIILYWLLIGGAPRSTAEPQAEVSQVRAERFWLRPHTCCMHVLVAWRRCSRLCSWMPWRLQHASKAGYRSV